MKLKKVSPLKISIPDVRVTSVLDDETKQMLRDSMTGQGQLAPILCIETAEGLVLVDGYNRLMTAITEKWETIEVAIAEGDMVDVLTRNLFLDHIRGKHTPGQMLTVIEALTKEYGMDSEQIAKKTGLKRDYVESFQLISQLTPLCRAALDEERIKLGHARALTALKDPVKQETVLWSITQYNMSVRDTEALIADVLAMMQPPGPAQPPKQPPPPIKLRCAYCNEEYDLCEVSNPTTCRGCAGTLAQAIAIARVEASNAKVAPNPATT